MRYDFKSRKLPWILAAMILILTVISSSFTLTFAEPVEEEISYSAEEDVYYEEAVDPELTADSGETAEEYAGYEEDTVYYEEALSDAEPETWEDTGLQQTEDEYMLISSAEETYNPVPLTTDTWNIYSWIYLQDQETDEYAYSASDKALEITGDDLNETLGAEIWLSGMAPGTYDVCIQLTYDLTGIWTQFIKAETVTINENESIYGKIVRIPFGTEIPDACKKSGIYHISVDVTGTSNDPYAVLNKYDYAYETFWDLRESYEILADTDPAQKSDDQGFPEEFEEKTPTQIWNTLPAGKEDPEENAGDPFETDTQEEYIDPVSGPGSDGRQPAAPQGSETAQNSEGPSAGTDPQDASAVSPGEQNPSDSTAASETPSSGTAQTSTAYVPTFRDTAQVVTVGYSSAPPTSGASSDVLLTYSMSEGPGGSLGSGGVINSSSTGPTLYAPVSSSSSSQAPSGTKGKTASAPSSAASLSSPGATLNVLASPGSGSPVSGTSPASGTRTSSGITAPTSGTSGSDPLLKVLSSGTQTQTPGASASGSSVPASGNKDKTTEQETGAPNGNPARTGDDSNAVMLIVIAAAALSVLAGAGLILRKNREH